MPQFTVDQEKLLGIRDRLRAKIKGEGELAQKAADKDVESDQDRWVQHFAEGRQSGLRTAVAIFNDVFEDIQQGASSTNTPHGGE